MQTMNLSRNDRRRRSAKAGKLYGLKGDKGLIIHQAYQALLKKELQKRICSLNIFLSLHPPYLQGD